MNRLTRRVLLGTAGAALCALPSASHAADTGPDAFMKLSIFLTGHADLEAPLGPRYLAALIRGDSRFAADMMALAQAAAGKASMDAFLLSTQDAALMRTATQIVSAWYLGVVGSGEESELIAYEDTLMYRPTAGMAVIPSYCVGPSYWTAAPQSLSN